jgi:hypothetical protein
MSEEEDKRFFRNRVAVRGTLSYGNPTGKRPVSRVLSVLRLCGREAAIYLVFRSQDAKDIERPTRRTGRRAASFRPADGTELLPTWSCTGWGLPAPRKLPPGAVGSYPTFSLLTPVFPAVARMDRGGLFSVALSVAACICKTAPSLAQGTLLCGARTFLPPKVRLAPPGSGCPVSSCHRIPIGRYNKIQKNVPAPAATA